MHAAPRIAAIAILATPLLFAPTAVHADSARRAPYVKISPSPAILRGGTSTWITIAVDYERADVAYASMEMRPANGSDGYDFAFLDDPDGDGVWTGQLKLSSTMTATRWRVETDAIVSGGGTIPGPSTNLTVRAATRTGLKAPKAVKRGVKAKLSGTLKITEWGSYRPAPGRWVSLYFRRTGGKKWVWAGRAKTGRLGGFAKTVKVSRAGTWQARFSGGAYAVKSASAGHYVRVK